MVINRARAAVEVDGCVAVGELQVARSELLAANEHAVAATFEGEVAAESTGAIVHKDTLLTAALVHLEVDILKTGGLCDLPMDCGCGIGGASKVEDQVANLAEEVVLVDEPLNAID